MARPTEDAIFLFDTARDSAQRALTQGGGKNAFSVPTLTAHAVFCIAQGLSSLSTGLRATYIKLEEVEAQIRKQR
jgi:hypothetical protein